MTPPLAEFCLCDSNGRAEFLVVLQLDVMLSIGCNSFWSVRSESIFANFLLDDLFILAETYSILWFRGSGGFYGELIRPV